MDQSRFWGSALVARRDESPAARIDHMFRKALGRPPDEEEREHVAAFVGRLAEIHGVAPADVPTSQAVWQDAALTMFNMKELIYIR